ncbi:MAG: RhuM family protein [bacterium]
MIISVGYRVNSDKAMQFRQWATNLLHDFAIRGYVLDKERLKNAAFFSKKHFDDFHKLTADNFSPEELEYCRGIIPKQPEDN